MKKRYNIGLVVGNVEDDFSNQVCKGAMRAAELVDDNLFVFPVKYWGQTEEARNDLNQRYEYQYNYLMSYAQSRSLDMVLVCMSTIGYRTTAEQCKEILRGFGDVPVLLVASNDTEYCSIKYDNVTGLGAGIRYLIDERQCSHIGMVTGNTDNDDAKERLQVYKDVLTEKGIEIEERRIAYGDYSGKCVPEIEKLLVNNPDLDAIVCANDAMAESVYEVLQKYHFSIGKDICVLGFDDVADAAFMEPPLATVRADASILGYRAMVECHDMLREYDATHESEGEEIPVRNLPIKSFLVDTAFVLRESASGVKARKKLISEEKETEYLNKLSMMVDMNHTMNIVSRDMLMFGSDGNQNYTKVLDALDMNDVSSYFLYMTNKPVVYHEAQKWRLPEAMYLRAYKTGEKALELPRSKQRISMNELFSNSYYLDERKTYIIIDIYSRELQYGILVCDMPYRYFHYVEMLCYQISIAIKIKELFFIQEKLLEDKEEMVQKLERENLYLDDISNKDELTGILNRRGFFNKLEEQLTDAKLFGKKAVMLYADLNYLKLINDRYTHAEGNYALRSCAEALEAALGQNGIVGRIGGDEFAGCALVEEAGDGEAVKKHIKEFLADRNKVSGKPYEVMTAVGTFDFVIGDEYDSKQLAARADERLYEDKSKKGPFVERTV